LGPPSVKIIGKSHIQHGSDYGGTVNDYHTEAVLGYLTAVLDSLNEENPTCAYLVSGREFCRAFKSFMKTQRAPGGSFFSHARAGIAENFECGKEEIPTSDTGAR
jgi:hypothetical protein